MMKPDSPTPVQPMASPEPEGRLVGFASMATMVAIWLFVITFNFQNFVIPSASMASTLPVGDHVVVDRTSLAPKCPRACLIPYRELRRDETVVFFRPAPNQQGDHEILVKRVIGLPGDRLHLRHGIVYRNGTALQEPYATKPTQDNSMPYNEEFPSISPMESPGVLAAWAVDLPGHLQGEDLVVPEGHYFMMGDNRSNSLDSRYWSFVPRENLIGRPLFVYWSFKTADDDMYRTSLAERTDSTLHTLIHFFDETRWSRTLHRIN